MRIVGWWHALTSDHWYIIAAFAVFVLFWLILNVLKIIRDKAIRNNISYFKSFINELMVYTFMLLISFIIIIYINYNNIDLLDTIDFYLVLSLFLSLIVYVFVFSKDELYIEVGEVRVTWDYQDLIKYKSHLKKLLNRYKLGDWYGVMSDEATKEGHNAIENKSVLQVVYEVEGRYIMIVTDFYEKTTLITVLNKFDEVSSWYLKKK